jgi:hypothetical protein
MKALSRPTLSSIALPAAALLALAGCSEPAEEDTYAVDAEDVSGGELQVSDTGEDAVPVDVPEVEMTNVPPEDLESGGD